MPRTFGGSLALNGSLLLLLHRITVAISVVAGVTDLSSSYPNFLLACYVVMCCAVW